MIFTLDLAVRFVHFRLLFRSDHGGIAQLGEHLICIQKVAGSIPVASTKLKWVVGIKEKWSKKSFKKLKDSLDRDPGFH